MMGLILKILLYMHMCPGVLSVHQLSWLPCQFIDERVTVNKNGQYESQHNRREATLQFGQSGDSPVNPQAITFLVTGGSKLDLRRYMEGAEAEQLECEVRRYSTEGIHVRWPVQQPQEYNRWFSCTIKHSKGLFTATGFLRHPSDQPPPGKPDYHSWPAIADREILTTTVAMVIKTQSPSVIARLNTQPKLHCQFALDHRGPNIMVEWYFQHRGERNKLVRYNSHSGAGDISYVLPHTKISNAGTYICSVTVDPLFVSLDVKLQIEEPPHVSINGGPTLALHRGEDFKVMCDAENYYPLDVEIVWYEQDPEVSGQSVGAPLPKPLGNILLSSHKQKNSVYSVSGFFYLHARYMDSGKQYTCSVFHSSLRMPIKKSFILTVKEPRSLTILKLCTPLISLVGVLCMLLSYRYSRKKKRSAQVSEQRKSYY